MRNLKQRLFSLLLCAALAVSLCVPAAAEETETYLTWNGSELVSAEVPASIKEVTTGTTELNDTTTGGWYIVRGSVEISSRVTVTGNVHLILKDGCELKAAKGINVGEDNSLTIMPSPQIRTPWAS